MSIQRRVSLVLLIAIVISGSLSYWLLASQVTPAFLSLENETAKTNIARVEAALDNDIAQLSLTNGDWAVWNETHQFISGLDDSYLDANLNVATFEQLDIDLVMFRDLNAHLHWGMFLTEVSTDDLLLEQLDISPAAANELVSHLDNEAVVAGLIETRIGPLMVSSRPIVKNEFAGPIAGTLILGQLLDSKHVKSLQDRTEVDLGFLPIDDPEIVRLKQSNGATDADYFKRIESEIARFDYVQISDITGDPITYLRVRMPRDAMALGARTLDGSLMSLAVLFCFIAVVIWTLLRLIVVQPLLSLTRHVTEIRQSGDMSKTFEVERNDEIGELAAAFSSIQKSLIQRDNEIRQSVETLEFQATHDALTGLSNRRILYEKLEELNEAETIGYCVCIMDLDGFKSVNDTSGHAAGDALLVQVATLLVEAVYDTDTVIRLGGDEFALILHNCSDETAIDVCEKIRRGVESLIFCWEDMHHRIGVSIGVLSVSNAFGNVSEILQQADAACFSAKERGRNNVYMVADDAPNATEERREQHWANRLATAIDNNQFLLFTQVIVPLQNANRSEPEQLEVLVRLRDFSTKKLIPPGAFVPPAERYKLSSKIDRWVLTQILKYMTVYADVFDDSRKYWVNLSSNSLADGEFTSFLETSIQNSKIKPGRLNFEIAESSAMQNLAEVAKVMSRLKSLGCQFALDDFGTGFSSFNHLQSLPIDYLKIDGLVVRKILQNPIDRMFVKSIIDIAQAMNIKTIAEFLEQDDLIDEVTALGADYGQGFALGRPQELMPSRQVAGPEEEAG